MAEQLKSTERVVAPKASPEVVKDDLSVKWNNMKSPEFSKSANKDKNGNTLYGYTAK
jgi:hypothetical protein